jgi:hypothetical protein
VKNNPLARLDHQELIWLFGILKDACRERLEKNLINQRLEERLYQQHGAVPGRIDPRVKLKEWEPRYRKLLAAAAEIEELSRRCEVGELAQLFAERFGPGRETPRSARRRKPEEAA